MLLGVDVGGTFTDAVLAFDGKVVTTFRGVPVRTVDAILSNETQVT